MEVFCGQVLHSFRSYAAADQTELHECGQILEFLNPFVTNWILSYISKKVPSFKIFKLTHLALNRSFTYLGVRLLCYKLSSPNFNSHFFSTKTYSWLLSTIFFFRSRQPKFLKSPFIQSFTCFRIYGPNFRPLLLPF